MEGQKLGIDEVRKVFLAVIDAGNACGIAFEDNKIGLGDINQLMTFSHSMKELATNVDFEIAMPQFADIDALELEDLAGLVEENLDIPQEAVEAAVERIFVLGAKWHSLIRETILFVRHPGAAGCVRSAAS